MDTGPIKTLQLPLSVSKLNKKQEMLDNLTIASR